VEETFLSVIEFTRGYNDVRQTEIRTAELLAPKPNAFEVEMAIEKVKDTNHQVLIKSQQNLLTVSLRSINSLILFGIRRNCVSSGKGRSLYLFIGRVMTKTVVNI
jgi:hypothetical protein